MKSSVYRGRAGQWAFLAHRVTGMLVFLFLLLHVVDVSLINADPKLYDEVHDLYGNVLLRIFEVGLLGALIFHSLNGLRIVVYDFFPEVTLRHKELLTVVVGLTVVLTIVGGYFIMLPFFEGLGD